MPKEADMLYVDLREDRGTQLALGLVPGVPLMLQPLRVGDAVFNLVVPDVDAVMDAYIAAGQEDWDPYWARPWPSAAALAAHLLGPEGAASVRGAAVAELGAGLGLAGLAAALAGAQRVVLMDREPVALVCAALSAAASGIPVEGLHDGGDVAAAATTSGSRGGSRDWQEIPGAQQQLLPQRQGQQQVLAVSSTQHSGQLAGSRAAAAAFAGSAGSRSSGGSGSDTGSSGNDCGGSSSSSGSGSGGGGGGGGGGGARDALLPAWPDGIPDLRQAAGMLLQEMARLHIPLPPPREGAGAVALQELDWSGAAALGDSRYDVLLACDVLYESYSVAPIAELAPRLLFSSGGRLLLADPAERTVQNRADFVDLVGRGKVGLGLEAEVSQLVAIDGQQSMMGGPSLPAPAPVRQKGTAEGPSGNAEAAASAAARLSREGRGGGIVGDSGSGAAGDGGSSCADGSLGDRARQGLPAAQPGQRPGSVVAVRLMSFRRGWDAGTVTPHSTL